MPTPNEKLLADIFGDDSLIYETQLTTDGFVMTRFYPRAVSADGELIIPAMINDKPVVAIADNALAPLLGSDVLERVVRLVVPETVRVVSEGALSGTGIPIKVNPANPTYSSDEVGALFDKGKTVLISYPTRAKIAEYRIPNTVVQIGAEALAFCESLATVFIPASVERIEEDSFLASEFQLEVDPDNRNFSSIDGVLFDKTQRTILRYPPNAPSETYAIPNTVTKLDAGAFTSCENLSTVILPASVEQIAPRAFTGCNLAIEVVEDNPNFRSVSGILFDKSGETLLRSLLVETEIPDGTKRIGPHAFNVYNSISSIHIPASVESIGERAFSDCYFLETLTFSGGALVSIADFAFCNCPLTSVVLPHGLRSIGKKAFARCYELTELVLPEGLTSIGSKAFTECASLQSVVLPKSLVEIGEDAFKEDPEERPVKLIVYKDSYAEKWAKENDVEYEVIE